MHFLQNLLSYMLPVQLFNAGAFSPPPPVADGLLLEDGTYLLLEDGTNLLLDP